MAQSKLQKSEIPVLLNPPLVESIYELRWDLQGDPQTGRFRDVSYPMMYGRMYEKLKAEFPLIEDLPSIQMHPEAAPFVVRHRMRKEKNGWPLMQIGPGILTINDGKGYSWTQFKRLILLVVNTIVELYPEEVFPLNFIKSEVRYINAIAFDIQRENPLDFLEEKLHIKVALDKEMFENENVFDKPNAVSVNLAYALNRPLGNLMLSANLGQIDGRPAYILQSVVQSMGETVPQEEGGMKMWLEEAHEASEHSFMTLCKGTLLKRFCGN
jgi:uncharacterized protein (TIGR04255 family)